MSDEKYLCVNCWKTKHLYLIQCVCFSTLRLRFRNLVLFQNAEQMTHLGSDDSLCLTMLSLVLSTSCMFGFHHKGIQKTLPLPRIIVNDVSSKGNSKHESASSSRSTDERARRFLSA